MLFDVTYEIVTQESAEQGDAEERGYIGQALTLRAAIDEVRSTRTSAVDGVSYIHADSPDDTYRTIVIGNGMEFETGAQEARSLHIPREVSVYSYARILRLVRA